jgi:hypothetical protein
MRTLPGIRANDDFGNNGIRQIKVENTLFSAFTGGLSTALRLKTRDFAQPLYLVFGESG